MNFRCFAVLISVLQLWLTTVTGHGLHLPLYRRGGRFLRRQAANLTDLDDIMHQVEARYSLTHRQIKGNHLVRQWRVKEQEAEDENDENLIDVAGYDNRWFTQLEIGEPRQKIEVEIDMLNPDFYTIATTSGMGSRYDPTASTTHVPNDDTVHSICKSPSDIFHFPTHDSSSSFSSLRLTFPICTPSKASRQSLSRSGTVLGLSPPASISPSLSLSLSRLTSPPLLSQLHNAGLITEQIFSITLLDAESGILSLGGTIAREVEMTKLRSTIELEHFGDPSASPQWVAEQVDGQMEQRMPSEMKWDEHFKWMDVRGAKGWWTGLMAGVWVNGVKILKFQPILLDINSPFILAPALATTHLYSAISGSHPLTRNQTQLPHHGAANFYTYPCLNPPVIVLELGGWMFPLPTGHGVLTNWDAMHGPDGGGFSLGKKDTHSHHEEDDDGDDDDNRDGGSGFCVGNIVGRYVDPLSRMEKEQKKQFSDSGPGLADTWVLGEPVFRGLGVVFDLERDRVGFRTY